MTRSTDNEVNRRRIEFFQGLMANNAVCSGTDPEEIVATITQRIKPNGNPNAAVVDHIVKHRSEISTLLRNWMSILVNPPVGKGAVVAARVNSEIMLAIKAIEALKVADPLTEPVIDTGEKKRKKPVKISVAELLLREIPVTPSP